MEFLPQAIVIDRLLGLVARHQASGPMARGAECFGHGDAGAREHVGGGPHRSGDEDRLAGAAVALGNSLAAGAERARRAFAMDDAGNAAVLLKLGDIVGDVVDDAEIFIPAQNALPYAPHRMGDELAVAPCKVLGRPPRPATRLALP